MPDTIITKKLIAAPSLALFVSEIEKAVQEGFVVDFEGDYPSNVGVLFTTSVYMTEESRNQADRAKIARAKRASLEQAERAYMETLGKVIDENKKEK